MLVKSTELRCESGWKTGRVELADAAAFAQQWGSWRGSGGLRFQARRSYKYACFAEGASRRRRLLKANGACCRGVQPPRSCMTAFHCKRRQSQRLAVENVAGRGRRCRPSPGARCLQRFLHALERRRRRHSHPKIRHRRPNQKPTRSRNPAHFGSVPSVAAAWWSSRDLPRPNSNSVLHPFSSEPPHETTIPAPPLGAPHHFPPGCALLAPKPSCPSPTSPQTLAPTPRKLPPNQSGLRSCSLHSLLPQRFSYTQHH